MYLVIAGMLLSLFSLSVHSNPLPQPQWPDPYGLRTHGWKWLQYYEPARDTIGIGPGFVPFKQGQAVQICARGFRRGSERGFSVKVMLCKSGCIEQCGGEQIIPGPNDPNFACPDESRRKVDFQTQADINTGAISIISYEWNCYGLGSPDTKNLGYRM